MYGKELVKALLANEKVDRVGVSGWVHFPEVDRNVKDFAHKTIHFTDYNGYDFIKMMFCGHFMTASYGGKINYSTDPSIWHGDVIEHPIAHISDYVNLKPLDIEDSPLMLEVEATRRVAEHYKGKIPIVVTLFSPITSAQELTSYVNPTSTIKMMKYSPKELHHALEALTETIIRFGKKLIEAGADGVFYANQYATTDVMTVEQHNEFSKPYDFQVLNALRDAGAWFNILHMHGTGNYLTEQMLEYPVDAFNWENITPPDKKPLSIAEMRSLTDKLLITGIDQHHDFHNPYNDREAIKDILRRRLEDALKVCDDKRLIFAPGCALPGDVPAYVFTLMREVVDEMM